MNARGFCAFQPIISLSWFELKPYYCSIKKGKQEKEDEAEEAEEEEDME